MVNVEGNKVIFRFFRPQAKRVHLVGDFNHWRENELAMTLDDKGYWQAVLYLPEGDYRFRYRADNSWFTDYAAFGIEYGPFGADAVIRIEKKLPPTVKVAAASMRGNWTGRKPAAATSRRKSQTTSSRVA
jgi:1,4-alpha-glucan branching enzyme